MLNDAIGPVMIMQRKTWFTDRGGPYWAYGLTASLAVAEHGLHLMHLYA
jgi:hypothetical protein